MAIRHPLVRARSAVLAASLLAGLSFTSASFAAISWQWQYANAEVSAEGTVWVLERASDGARLSVEFSGKVVAGAATSIGTAVVVTAISTGYVLSAAGEAIAFIPNEIGASLLHNERVTQRDRVTP